MLETIYEYAHELITGVPISFSEFKGKLLLFVNTASRCGFTPQYKELEELYQEYKDRGLVVLGFPADDFMHQEPGSDAEIAQFCELNFGVTFPLFRKSHVKGKDQNLLFQWLDSQPRTKGHVLWNFEKFLVSPNGEAVARYRSVVSPLSDVVKTAITELLGS